MTAAEREALLKLWEDVPELRPQTYGYSGSIWLGQGTNGGINVISDNHAAAIARDAMVEYLHDQCWQHSSAKQPHNPDPNQRYILWHGGSIGHTGETRLLALISACRKLAGKDSE